MPSCRPAHTRVWESPGRAVCCWDRGWSRGRGLCEEGHWWGGGSGRHVDFPEGVVCAPRVSSSGPVWACPLLVCLLSFRVSFLGAVLTVDGSVAVSLSCLDAHLQACVVNTTCYLVAQSFPEHLPGFSLKAFAFTFL